MYNREVGYSCRYWPERNSVQSGPGARPSCRQATRGEARGSAGPGERCAALPDAPYPVVRTATSLVASHIEIGWNRVVLVCVWLLGSRAVQTQTQNYCLAYIS